MITEKIKSPEEISRFNKLEYMKAYRLKHRTRLNMYQKRYYHSHRDEILDKKIKAHYRRCLWCGLNIDHIKPRNVKFCTLEHGKLYRNKVKRDAWRKKYGSVPKVQDVQCAQVSAPQPPQDSTAGIGASVPPVQNFSGTRDDRY